MKRLSKFLKRAWEICDKIVIIFFFILEVLSLLCIFVLFPVMTARDAIRAGQPVLLAIKEALLSLATLILSFFGVAAIAYLLFYLPFLALRRKLNEWLSAIVLLLVMELVGTCLMRICYPEAGGIFMVSLTFVGAAFAFGIGYLLERLRRSL